MYLRPRRGIGYGKYLGKTMCGFINANEYQIKITKDLYGYTIQGITNLTEEKDCAGCIQYASEISLRRNWDIPNLIY